MEHSKIMDVLQPVMYYPIRLHGLLFIQAQDVFISWCLLKHRDKFIFIRYYVTL